MTLPAYYFGAASAQTLQFQGKHILKAVAQVTLLKLFSRRKASTSIVRHECCKSPTQRRSVVRTFATWIEIGAEPCDIAVSTLRPSAAVIDHPGLTLENLVQQVMCLEPLSSTPRPSRPPIVLPGSR